LLGLFDDEASHTTPVEVAVTFFGVVVHLRIVCHRSIWVPFNLHRRYIYYPNSNLNDLHCSVNMHRRYDLSRLSRRTEDNAKENWEVIGKDTGCGTFHINICAPLIRTDSSPWANGVCPHSTAVCATDALGKAQSVGAIAQGGGLNALKMTKGGDIMLRYDAPGSCSSEIVFRCMPGRIGEPYFISLDTKNCVYHFEWRTSAACPVKDTSGDDCKVKDATTGFTYDMNPLRDEPNDFSIAFDARDADGNLQPWLVDVNICGALNAPKQPIEHVGVMFRTVDGKQTFAGCRESSVLKLTDGGVSMEMNSASDHCFDNTPGKQRTVIDFVCNETAAMDSKPTMIDPSVFASKDKSEVDACALYLDWQTPFACPPQETPCVTEDEGGAQYDLSTLIKRDGNWQVPAIRGESERKYELNVCRSLVPIAGRTASCQAATSVCGLSTDPGGSTDGQRLATATTPRWDSIQKAVVIESKVSDSNCPSGETSTVIVFQCNPNGGIGKPRMTLEDATNCRYNFIFISSAACKVGSSSETGGVGGTALEIECTATDPKTLDRYDLSYLRNARYNWVADDEREVGKYDYEMNVCADLVPGSTECDDGVGACQLIPGKEGHKSLGLPSGPQVDENGQLYLEYSGGDPCVWGGNGNNRSTRIDFHCPTDETGNVLPGVLGKPTFIEEDENCGYHFEWSTSFACKIVPSRQKDCKVTDLLGGSEYDFYPLQHDEAGAYSAGKFIFNVCGNVTCGDGVAGACYNSGSSAIPLGSSNRSPYFDEGSLYLAYKGTTVDAEMASDLKDAGLSCPAGQNWESRVELVCDPKQPYDADPNITVVEIGVCNVVLRVATLLACESPSNLVECMATDYDSGATYDLSSLGRTGTNWIALDGREQNKYEYEINICRSLAHVPNNHKGCSGFGACQVSRKADSSGGFAEKGLGVPTPPTVNNGTLTMLMDDGVKCPDGTPRSTKIIFTCGTRTGSPVFLTEQGKCQYVFTWTTSAACPLGQPATSSPTDTTRSCRATDHSTGLVYDLGSLAGPVYVASNANPDESRKFELGICSTPVTCGSDQNAVACVDGTKVIGTKDTTGPQYLSGVVTLTYTSDEPCVSSVDGKPSTSETLIIFECDLSAGKGTPQFVHQADQCTYVFKWRTNAVCMPILDEVPCVVTGTNADGTAFNFDFGPLVRERGNANWLAVDPLIYDSGAGSNHEYLINVCRSLNTVLGHPECDGHAVCQVKATDDDFAFGIGDLAQSSTPAVDAKGLVSVTYPPEANAPMCHTKYQRSSRIVFSCLEGSLGAPVFVEETDTCDYIFEWRTSAACTERDVTGSTCKVEDPVRGVQFDLSPLTGTEYFAQHSDAVHNYSLSICGGMPESSAPCDGRTGMDAGACQRATDGHEYSLGKQTSPLEIDDGMLTLKFTDGTPCGSEFKSVPRSSTIQFVCDTDAGIGTPEFRGEPNVCSYLFTWRTVLACSEAEESECVAVDETTGDIYDLRELEISKPGVFWNVDTKQKDTSAYKINVCHSLVTGLTGTSGKPAPGCGNANTAVCMTTVDGLSVPLGTPTVPTFANGVLSILYNTPTGPNAQKCSNGNPKRARINFACGESGAVGQPVLTSTGDDGPCEYVFEWKSAAACKVKTVIGTEPCKVKDPVTGVTFDLNGLAGKDTAPVYSISGINDYFNYQFGDVCASTGEPLLQVYTSGDHEPINLGKPNPVLVLRGRSEVIQTFEDGLPCAVLYFWGEIVVVRGCVWIPCLLWLKASTTCDNIMPLGCPSSKLTTALM
jgi:insulin-like growth factor 2 receptor